MLPKLTKDEFIVLNLVIVSGVLLIIISSYVFPRIVKVYWNSSKRLLQYIITFAEKRIQNFRQIKKCTKIRAIFSKIFLPLKYVGFIESGVIRLGSFILVKVKNKIL